MTRFDGELSPPFEITEPGAWRGPIFFNSPHSGSVYPREFLSASRIDIVALRRSEDSFMDELIGGLSERGFPVVRVNFPRSYVDVNREPYELDPRMFSGRLPSFANTRSMRVAGGRGGGSPPFRAWWATARKSTASGSASTTRSAASRRCKSRITAHCGG